ncbi:MAG: hypothetical protein ACKOCI_04510 [Cyanobium sp.]
MALALSALLLMISGCDRQVAVPPSGPLPVVSPAGRLQEVPPPGAVVQISAALANRRPRLQITSPAEGTLVPAGPWQLGLDLKDWPLAMDPELGLGAHLVVQVDDGPGLRIGDWSQGNAGSGRLELAMAPLTPGSHRITAYAALPWGEAVKLPGASAQRLVQRVAANPLSQPASGTPQLLAVSPDGLSASEPVLIDWLLRDAPLQGLREGDARWRLRISVNGDSFLVDQNTPLWLRGLKSGSNALLLELLDGLGEPLNPPFNSLVREAVIQPGGRRPVWLNERISPPDLARLLGETAPQASAVAPEPEPEPAPSPAPHMPLAEPQPTETPPLTDPSLSGNPSSIKPPLSEPELPPPPVPSPAPQQEPEAAAATPPNEAPQPGEAPLPELTEVEPAEERIQPSTSLGGSAREQVSEDGSLIQPRKEGPFSGLAARLRP